jgi:peptidoglycan/xylan/chitin deacetylase (PgdA/CDA1 family)
VNVTLYRQSRIRAFHRPPEWAVVLVALTLAASILAQPHEAPRAAAVLVHAMESPTTSRPAQGYWSLATDGGVFSWGNVAFFGSAAGLSFAPAVSLAPTPTAQGYWIAALDGGVFSFGDAVFYGSAAGISRAPVIGLTPTPSGTGYWLVALDGGVFSFGDAPFFGSAAGAATSPVVGIASTPTGRGYWIATLDGGVFSFGDAPFFGSGAPAASNASFAGLMPTPTAQGYWLVARDGTVSAFGDATTFPPPAGSPPPADPAPIVGLARPGGPASTGGLLVADGSPRPPAVALTFDDGPDPSHTAGILDILNRQHVPGTFFLIGMHAAQYPDLVQAEGRRGFSVQDHTWTHPFLTSLSPAGVAGEVGRTQGEITQLTGVAPHCVRPPYGAHNAMTDGVIAGDGLHVTMWNDDPRDWTGISARGITQRVLSQLQPVTVVELHDRTAIIDALPGLIDALRERGYHFATICQTSGAMPGSPL